MQISECYLFTTLNGHELKRWCVYMNIKGAYISVSPERRNLDLQLLTLPEAAALLLASLQKPQEGTDVVTSFSSGLRTTEPLSRPAEMHIQSSQCASQ